MEPRDDGEVGWSAWRTVLVAGLVAGTLDIAFAWTYWALKAGLGPGRIFQSVAAGLLGPASYEGGVRTAALGLVLQIFIATTMAAVYFVASRRWPTLRRRPVAAGAAYGLLLYVVMNRIVVPLSAASAGSRDPAWIAASIVAHAALVGVPIAMICARSAGTR